MAEDYSQVDLKKMTAAIHSQERKQILEGLADGTLVLTVSAVLEIISNHIVAVEAMEYVTNLTLMFLKEPVIHFTVGRVGGTEPNDINKSQFFRQELLRHLTLQSTYIWAEVFKDPISFGAASTINKQPEVPRGRQEETMEELIDDDDE